MALTGQINQHLSRALREVIALHRLSRGVGRYRWLREQARLAAPTPAGGEPAGGSAPPDRLTRGIELRNVGFTYPNAATPVLTGVDLMLPAGSIRAR